MDVLFVIDATGSMSSAIRAATDRVTTIAAELEREHSDTDIRFGSICYRDPVDVRGEKHEVHPFGDIHSLHNFLKTIDATGGGDGPEDWVGALRHALDLNWRDGTRTMIWVADAPAHGCTFCGYNNHEDQTELLPPLIRRVAEMQIYFQALDMGAERTFRAIKAIYEEAQGPHFTISPFNPGRGTVRREVVVPVVSTDVLGRDFSEADYPKDYSSDDGYDSDSESHDVPMRKYRPPVYDTESVARAYTEVIEERAPTMEEAIVRATMDICRAARTHV